MTKVSRAIVNEQTPSEKIIKRVNEEFETIDELGRSIKVRQYSRANYYQFLGGIGEVTTLQLNCLIPALFVCEIDGHRINFPARASEAIFILDKLGQAGEKAVAECVYENIMQPNEDKEAKDEIKKL